MSYYRVLYQDEIFQARSGEIESNCNQLILENLTSAPVKVNEKILMIGERKAFPEGNPHPLEYNTTKYVVKNVPQGFLGNPVPRIRIERKFITVMNEPLPTNSTEVIDKEE